MNASEKVDRIKQILESAGVRRVKAAVFTTGGGRIEFDVSQNGKARVAELTVRADGSVEESKYAYLLPDAVESAIKSL